MVQAELVALSIVRVLIEALSALVIVGHCVVGMYLLAVTRNIRKTQLLVANGALLGFNIKLIAALLAVMQLQTWDHIGMFGCVLALRTLLKKVLQWEKRELQGVESA